MLLDKGLDMPPLMLTTDEIEAAVLGAQWVINRGDPQLAKAAQDLLAKIEASIPERLRPYIDDPAHRVVPAWERAKDVIDLGMVRGAINGSRKMLLDYRDVEGRATKRVIWPIILGYYETTRIICAWCETRKDFRSFRSDRVVSASVLDERFPELALHPAREMAKGDGGRLEAPQSRLGQGQKATGSRRRLPACLPKRKSADPGERSAQCQSREHRHWRKC